MKTVFPLALVLVAAGCGGDVPTAAPTDRPSLVLSPDGSGVTGGGQFVHPTFGPFNFAFNARRAPNGSVSGRFEYHYFVLDAASGSAPVHYRGDVTCFAVDLANRRAWIGGVLTGSNDPSSNPIVHPGHDAWFRVLDAGSPNDQAGPDRITLLGFEGAIPSSAQYCADRIWPDDNARTWPVESGNLTIH